MNEWIKWKGGSCPVAFDEVIDIKIGKSLIVRTPAYSWEWDHERPKEDRIVAYRFHSSAAKRKLVPDRQDNQRVSNY